MVFNESRSTSVTPFVTNHTTVYSSPRAKCIYKSLFAGLRIPDCAETDFRQDLSISFHVLEGYGY